MLEGWFLLAGILVGATSAFSAFVYKRW